MCGNKQCVGPVTRNSSVDEIGERYDTYDTIRYDSVYLTCSKKLTGSELSLHGINQKINCETKNKMMSVIGALREN